MTKIILCGCSGHMGHVVTEIAAADAEVEIVAGIDLCQGRRMPPIRYLRV